MQVYPANVLFEFVHTCLGGSTNNSILAVH